MDQARDAVGGFGGCAVREGFLGYFQPTEDEFNKLWDDGEVVVDTNVLLNLFRWPVALRDDLLKILAERKDRLWLPHQVALEFHRGRWTVVGEQEKKFAAITQALEKSREPVSAAIGQLHRLQADESATLKAQFDEALLSFEEALARHKATWESHSEIFDNVTDLYDGLVGPSYSEEELAALYVEGAERFEKGVPPGYKDQEKNDDTQYGDFVLWRQLLDHSKSARLPVIFVTDDGKEDWWVKTGGKQRMPRRELVEEFFEASGQRIYIYSVQRFLSFAKDRGAAVSDEATKEALRSQELAEREALRRRVERQMRELTADKAAAVSRYARGEAALMDAAITSVPQERLEIIRRAFDNHKTLPKWLSQLGVTSIPKDVMDQLGISQSDIDAANRAGAEAAGINSDVYDAFRSASRPSYIDGATSSLDVTAALGVSAGASSIEEHLAVGRYRDSLVKEGIIDEGVADILTLAQLQAYESDYRASKSRRKSSDADY